jgi:hypothetical protein
MHGRTDHVASIRSGSSTLSVMSLATRQKITDAILIAESTKISVMQSCRTPMRHLFGTSSAVPEKILAI